MRLAEFRTVVPENTMLKKNPEVLISGAGPVGLFAALSLARKGITVEITDKSFRAGTHSYALALHPQSLGLLHEAGLLEQVMQMAFPVRHIGLYDESGRRAVVNIDDFPGSWSCLAVLRQDQFENLLEEALRKAGIGVAWSHEVFLLEPRDTMVAARVDKFEKDSVGYAVARTEWVLAKSYDLEAGFVLGADGHRSRVRRALRQDYPEVAPAQHYAVFEFETDAMLGDEVRLVLGGETTDVLWPLPGGACRWSFEMPDYHAFAERNKDRLFGAGAAGEYPELTRESLYSFITERAPWFAGRVGEIAWRNVVRFERRLASSFGAGRMWLAGDAAHLTGPAGVQSMNIGLTEASELAEIMAGAIRHGSKPAEFEAYNARWTAEWRKLLGINVQVHGTRGTDPWIVERGSRLLSALPAHGDDLSALLAQVGLELAAPAAA